MRSYMNAAVHRWFTKQVFKRFVTFVIMTKSVLFVSKRRWKINKLSRYKVVLKLREISVNVFSTLKNLHNYQILEQLVWKSLNLLMCTFLPVPTYLCMRSVHFRNKIIPIRYEFENLREIKFFECYINSEHFTNESDD